VLVVITALAFDFTNGFHDTGNAMATSIATGALPPRVAVALSGLLNLVGAFLSLAVAATIASGLVDAAEVTLQVVAAGLAGGIIWNLLTWLFGIPSSSSHALIGGVIGSTLAAAGGSRPPSVLRADELVEPRHRPTPRHGDRIAPGVTPRHPELIQRLTAYPENIRGLVCEQISRILVPVVAIRKLCPYSVHPAITIRVEQPASKPVGIFRDNDALPWLQLDFPHMLAARSMLREKGTANAANN
jgi:hypothetical protein